MTEQPIYLTKEGYQQYVDDIEKLHEKLGSSSKDKSESYRAAVGDGWHDNFAFENAKREELMVIKELEEKIAGLSRIVIVDKLEDSSVIDIDDIVRLSIQITPEKKREPIIKLIGEEHGDLESDTKEISINSPLGEAIYRQTVGTTVEYVVGNKALSAVIEERMNERVMNDNEEKTTIKR